MRRQESEMPAAGVGGLRGRHLAWEWLWAAGWLPSDSSLFLFPQFCLSPDAGRGASACLRCPPSPARPLPRGDSGGPLAVTPCAWSDPRSLPRHGSSLSPGLQLPHGAGGAHGGTEQRPWEEGAAPARWGRDASVLGRRLLLLLWGPLPYLHLPSSRWFFVSVVPFLFYSLSPFSQRNKGLEIAGPLVFVTRWRRGHHLRAPALRFCLDLQHPLCC